MTTRGDGSICPPCTRSAAGRNGDTGGISVCTPDVGASCDDESECTVNDACSALGVCVGTGVLVGAACEWLLIAGDPERAVRVRSGGGSELTGDLCGDTVSVGINTINDSDIIGTRTTGSKAVAMGIGPDSVLTGLVATGGGGIKARPTQAFLLGLDTSAIPAGGTAAGADGQIYDASGMHDRVDDCDDAQAAIESASAAIAAASSDATFGVVQIDGSLTIAPGSPVGVTAGVVNVVDMQELRSNVGGQLILDGGGNPATAYVIRVGRRISMLAQSEIVLQGGLTARNVILYSGGRRGCKFGVKMVGFGTVICPDLVLKLGGSESVEWSGVFMGGRRGVQVGNQAVMTHVPPTGIVSIP